MGVCWWAESSTSAADVWSDLPLRLRRTRGDRWEIVNSTTRCWWMRVTTTSLVGSRMKWTLPRWRSTCSMLLTWTRAQPTWEARRTHGEGSTSMVSLDPKFYYMLYSSLVPSYMCIHEGSLVFILSMQQYEMLGNRAWKWGYTTVYFHYYYAIIFFKSAVFQYLYT